MTIRSRSGRIPIAVQAAYGGIAQLARAFGSYPKCPRFESRCRYQTRAQTSRLRPLSGPLVKRLRHRPFTAVTWVRVPYGSPKQETPPKGGVFCFDNPPSSRDSRGAGVNDMPVACQSRAQARPQAGSPVRVTKKERIRSGFSLFWCRAYGAG